MTMLSASRCLLLAFALAYSLSGAAEIKTYRYSLGQWSGDPLYAGETTSASRGPRYRVEYDAQGRILRSTTLQDGNATSEVRYKYTGNERFANQFENYTAGELRGTGHITRNEKGERTRSEFRTLEGKITSYSTRSYGSSGVESISYTAAGKKGDRYFYTYSPKGLLVRTRWYPSDETYYDTEVDEATGLAKSRRKYDQNRLESSNAYAYDADGNRIRDDVYDRDGKWYGAREYQNGLKTVERYRFESGETHETRINYDEKRWVNQAKFSVNGKLVCTFTYDRLPNGAVSRTLAVGPNGELLAEYPDLYLDKVRKNGMPIDKDIGIIHKKGEWW
jgi:YD repeat-containing protein